MWSALGGNDEVTNDSRVQKVCNNRDSGPIGEARQHQPSDPECDTAQDNDRESGESYDPAKFINVDIT